MEALVIREDVAAFMAACEAFAEFSQYHELTPAEREVLANFIVVLDWTPIANHPRMIRHWQ